MMSKAEMPSSSWRAKPHAMHLSKLTGYRCMSATLQRDGSGEPWGLGVGYVDDSVVVTSIVPGSAAHRCGALAVMDRIIAINGVSVDRSNAGRVFGELFSTTDEMRAVLEFDFVFH